MYLGLNMNSPFPVITNDIKIRQELAEITEIRFMTQPNGTTVCSYVVSAEGTFDTDWAREARGLVFSANREIISRPLHKFFNINERPEVHMAEIDWSKVHRVMVKRDGSMIHTVGMQDEITSRPWSLKSKKSFESDVVKAVKDWLYADRMIFNRYDGLATHCVGSNLTAIFEWTSPTSRIVLSYKEPELQLLHVRNNHTGEYLLKEQLQELSDAYEIPLVEEDEVAREAFATLKPVDAIAKLSALTGVEGWVIQFENGDMVKLKTKEYIERHRYMTFLRVRDIANAVVDEQLDDLKAKLVGEGVDITQILGIEIDVVARIDAILNEITPIYVTDKSLERKDFAIKYKGHKFFGLLMQLYSGKEPDVKGYFRKHMLDELYGLEQINLVDTVAEVE